MTFTVTPHLNFRSQAREALDFYHRVFGGEKVLVTYADAGQPAAGITPDQIMWGHVKAADGFCVMAYDVQAEREYAPGENAFYLSLRGSSRDEIEARWNALAHGAQLRQPLGPSAWSPVYGMLTDRFGITWVVDLDPASAA